MRILFSALLIGHGWVHGVMWALPYSAEALADLPMDPAHSWLIGDTRGFSLGLAVTAAGAFIVAGIAHVPAAGWWPYPALVATGLSLTLLSLYFSPWWMLGYLIDVLVILVAGRALDAL